MLASLVLAATLTWSGSYDDALQRAAAEKKLVLVHYRAKTDAANREADAKLAKAEGNENITMLLESFVLVRTTDPRPRFAIAPPVLAVVDPDGRFLVSRAIGAENQIGAFLGTIRENAPRLLRSWGVAAVSPSAADVILAQVLLNFRQPKEASALLERAVREFERKGDETSALYAQLWSGVAIYETGDRSRGRQKIEWVANRTGAHPAIVAEAWVLLGDTRIAERLRSRAIDAYRNAYDIAPPGSGILNRARHALETYDSRPLPPKGEIRSAALRLIAPARRSVTGRTEFIVEADPGIARVEVSLDDVPVAQDEERPFRLKVDVGPLAVTRTLKAVGLNDSGDRIGEAFLTINDSVEAFRVSINAPAETFVSGDQEIQLEVQTPPMRTLERVELYWKETRIATLTAAPFRRKYAFPTEFGYLRAVAVLDDGSTAEDARIFNAEGVGESVDVRAVALLATVTDDEGKRIEGLTEKDFEILDEGTPVSATVRHATDTPVTIGIAIDTSSSMRTWLFEALEIASGFVRSGEGTDDRMFVTAFDEGPRLVHEVTTDAGSLLQRILDLQANGGTSIFDGVVFALQQFQNVPGRKALLVISDGKEGMSTQTANGAIRTARAAAIPIFTLGPPGPIGQTMRTLADATGGVAFGPRKTDLPAIFARIRDDVRGQYLITFEPHGVKAGTWRNLRVRARRADLKVRTVSGYYAR